MRNLILLFAFMACVCVSACERTPSPSGRLSSTTEKKPAPDITVYDLNGASLKLSTLKGKVVLLNFWATWCPPCREEIPSMMKLNSAMAGKPFQMVAVSLDEDGKRAIESFFRSTGFHIPAYTDSTGKAAAAYGVTGFPETFLIDKDGLIIKKIIGPLDWGAPEAISFIEGLMK